MKKIKIQAIDGKNQFKMAKTDTVYQGKLSKEEGEKLLIDAKKELKSLQELLYADGSQSLLIVIQAMDAAGKDSLVEHVFGGVNPQGCEVSSFKVPTSKDYNHDFLWRHELCLPDKGKIGIFNRSHYESVLVCKVHPEYNLSEKVWKNTNEIDVKFWENRYESIRDFEKHQSKNGTRIIKLFLNVSKEEQKKRFLDRIEQKEKNWKFSTGDLKERKLWNQYMDAYEDAINATAKEYAPWFVITADQKWFTRLAAIQIIIDQLKNMKLEFPKLKTEEITALQVAKKSLEDEK